MIGAVDLNACLVDAHVWTQRFVFFPVCLTMCVCVCMCFSGDQQFISLHQWLFSLQITRKVEMGLSQQPQLRLEHSSQLINVTLSCKGCIFGLVCLLIYFLVMTYFSLFSCWSSDATARWRMCNAKNPKMLKKGNKPLKCHVPPSGSDLIYILFQAFSNCFACCLSIVFTWFVPNYT